MTAETLVAERKILAVASKSSNPRPLGLCVLSSRRSLGQTRPSSTAGVLFLGSWSRGRTQIPAPAVVQLRVSVSPSWPPWALGVEGEGWGYSQVHTRAGGMEWTRHPGKARSSAVGWVGPLAPGVSPKEGRVGGARRQRSDLSGGAPWSQKHCSLPCPTPPLPPPPLLPKDPGRFPRASDLS